MTPEERREEIRLKLCVFFIGCTTLGFCIGVMSIRWGWLK